MHESALDARQLIHQRMWTHAHPHAGWNVLDFMVVVLAYLAYLPSIDNYTAVRTIRVLRPLRTITGVEGMRVGWC